MNNWVSHRETLLFTDWYYTYSRISRAKKKKRNKNVTGTIRVTTMSNKVITHGGTIGWKLHCSLSGRCESIQGRKNFQEFLRDGLVCSERFLFSSSALVNFVSRVFSWRIIGEKSEFTFLLKSILLYLLRN